MNTGNCLKTANFFELFGYNSKRNHVGRLTLKIDSNVYPPGFEFVPGIRYGTIDISKHADDLALISQEKDCWVLHMFVPDNSPRAPKFANHSPETRLYRYGLHKHLKDAQENGRFVIHPAIEFLKQEYDAARHDNELVHRKTVSPERIKFTLKNGEPILPTGPIVASFFHTAIDSYILCFSYDYDEALYDEFEGSDACLAINDVEAFTERVHAEFSKVMPYHLCINARVSYSNHPNTFGVLFSKDKRYLSQREYRFAWVPERPGLELAPECFLEKNLEEIRSIIPPPVVIQVGPLSDITTLMNRDENRGSGTPAIKIA